MKKKATFLLINIFLLLICIPGISANAMGSGSNSDFSYATGYDVIGSGGINHVDVRCYGNTTTRNTSHYATLILNVNSYSNGLVTGINTVRSSINSTASVSGGGISVKGTHSSYYGTYQGPVVYS